MQNVAKLNKKPLQLLNYRTVTATSKGMGKVLDSKTKNTLARWFKPRT